MRIYIKWLFCPYLIPPSIPLMRNPQREGGHEKQRCNCTAWWRRPCGGSASGATLTTTEWGEGGCNVTSNMGHMCEWWQHNGEDYVVGRHSGADLVAGRAQPATSTQQGAMVTSWWGCEVAGCNSGEFTAARTCIVYQVSAPGGSDFMTGWACTVNRIWMPSSCHSSFTVDACCLKKTVRREKKMGAKLIFYMVSLSSIGCMLYFNVFGVLQQIIILLECLWANFTLFWYPLAKTTLFQWPVINFA